MEKEPKIEIEKINNPEEEKGKEIDDRIIESDETDERGNHTTIYKCGCEATSGGGAHGTRGSAWTYNACHKHQESGYYK